MHKIILLALLGLVWPQKTTCEINPEEDLETLKKIYHDIIYDGHTTNGSEADKEKTSESIMCTTGNGYPGECVPFHQCGNIKDGINKIDIRVSHIWPRVICCEIEKNTKPNNVSNKVSGSDPQREGCGWSNPDGAGNQVQEIEEDEAGFGEFPWMVLVMKVEVGDDGKINTYYSGGGSLIHPSAVLTAAHYVKKSNMELKVRAGEWDTQQATEEYPHEDRAVKSVVTHEYFDTRNLFNDIAILFLETEFSSSMEHIGVVCLPPPKARVSDGRRCMSSGWGTDQYRKDAKYHFILKKVDLPVVDRPQCQTKLRRTRLGYNFKLHTSFMCAGGELGKDTCKGDGGSPLVCPIKVNGSRYMQSGIVSWGIGCGIKNPGVYTDVSMYREWIDEKMIEKGLNVSVYTP